jgi:4-amino-4-deoxy-L-arabinose transferase-like glycosyltransferase
MTNPRAAFGGALAFGAALLALPLAAHSDEGDAQLYRVLVRHMLEDHTWTDLRYEPNVHPHFREHLPFGLWPYCAAAHVLGEGALDFVGFLFGLAALAVTGLLARRLYGPWAGVAAVLVLGLTESFFDLAGRARLDGPLVVLATLAAAPVLISALKPRDWALAFAFASLAALVKGPFGLVPLAAACVARALTDRRPLVLVIGGAVTVLAAAPALLWLASDDSWWNGYVRDQLLASAVGARTDGATAPWLPFRVVLGRFWPGLPLVAFAVTKPRLRLVLFWSVATLLFLCLPTRKLWFHVLVAFPALAVTAGTVAAPWLERRHTATALGALAAALWLSLPLGLPRLIGKRPWVFCTDFAAYAHPPGTAAVVVAPWPWHAISALAAERAWTVTLAPALTPDVKATVALVSDEAPPQDLSGWVLRSHSQGWSFLERP